MDFQSEDWEGLWHELRDIVLFWVEQGVKIFRVDNPHTKPVPFWEWMIRTVQTEHPEVIFLSEAFTRPRMLEELAKVGFSQSYTYFTWRHGKWEFMEYLHHLTREEPKEYLRPNFFANTPDILPPILQKGGKTSLPATPGPGRNPFQHLRHLQRLRALRGGRGARQGRVPELREIRDKSLGLGPARQHKRLRLPRKPASA